MTSEPILLPEPTVCRWFLRCDHLTEVAFPHPVLGHVPVCDRCSRRMGMGSEGSLVLRAQRAERTSR
jgi:hypothetical protein